MSTNFPKLNKDSPSSALLIFSFKFSILILNCLVLFLSLIVMDLSLRESSSTVIQKGVPISSCRAYLRPIDPPES